MRPHQSLAAAVLATVLVGPAATIAQEAAPRQQPSEPPVALLQCSGNEPFWSLDLGPGSALLRRPMGAEVEETTFTGTLDTLGFLDVPWSVWRGAAASGAGVEGRGADLVAVVRREECRDSMKGDLRQARAVVSLPGGGVVTGCCNVRRPLEPTAAPSGDATGDYRRAH